MTTVWRAIQFQTMEPIPPNDGLSEDSRAAYLPVTAAFRGTLVRPSPLHIIINVNGNEHRPQHPVAANLLYTSISPVSVSGTVDDPNATVRINGVNAPVTTGRFLANVPLVEGLNTLTAVAPHGGVCDTLRRSRSHCDTTPPHLTIDSPVANSTTTASFDHRYRTETTSSLAQSPGMQLHSPSLDVSAVDCANDDVVCVPVTVIEEAVVVEFATGESIVK